ncbi:PGPGW domain-containing protein [Nocardiopsis sp. EMB25]|uniref:PGPGW domain-containing protein n=1 Tax=Nocardiopsis sp. EMB25 TaxID=2835867 RepID=UPI002284DB4A|nr:PGPGW domain-containing protein [Nocardiopsis sp. EMB25]MCY9784924.1 PGPGW domain-containing protein [Nocardiopsis sp. EMB25]
MHSHPALHLTWRVVVTTVAVLVIVAGLVMMVFPGPGAASVVLGLFILSSEFHWAHRLLRPARTWFRRAERLGNRLKDDLLSRLRARRAARRGLTAPDPD